MICNETITVEELSFIRHMMERHRYCTSCSTCWKNQYEYLPPPPRLEKIVDYSEFAEIKPKTMIFRPTKLDIYPPNESLKRKFYDEESERSPYGKLFKRTFEASVKDADAKIKQNDIPPVLKYIKQENQPYVVDNERHEHEVEKARYERNIKLYQFLIDLLEEKNPCVTWVAREDGMFKIIDSDRFARMWGEVKLNPTMNYEKLARSFRHYYKKGILDSDSTISKTGKRKLYYKFGANIIKTYIK